MSIAGRRALRLKALVGVCVVLFIPSLLAFLVNLELAIRALAPGWRVFENLLPGPIFRFFTPLAADLSAISTLVPVLLLVFPMAQGWRIIRRQHSDPDFAGKLAFDPYPPFFSFFMAMLGLEGTLYGLFLGLGVSRITELTAAALTADAIHGTLQRLLQGTATAILSSLVGLIGAFVAARPLNWFRRIALLDEAEVVEVDSLTETAQRLTGELQALGRASRLFSAQLKPEMLQNLFARLEQAASLFDDAAARLAAAAARLDDLAEGQRQCNALLKSMASRDEAGQRWLESAWDRLSAGLDASHADVKRATALAEQAQQERNAALAEAQAGRAATTAALAALLEDAKTGRTDLLGALGSLREAALAAAGETEREREAWRQALAAYLGRQQNAERSHGSKP